MRKSIRKKCEELWDNEEYRLGLEQLIEYRLRIDFKNALEMILKDETWFAEDSWVYHNRSGGYPRPTLEKKEWNPDDYPSRLFLKINPVDPAKGLLTISVKHAYMATPDSDKKPIMNSESHGELKEKIKEIAKNKSFRFVICDERSNPYIWAVLRESEIKDFDVANYPYIVGWTIRSLKDFNENFVPIIDSAIEKARIE